MPEGTKLNLRKLFPLMVIVSSFVGGWWLFFFLLSLTECCCGTPILAIDNTETDSICKRKNLLSV